MNDKIKKSPLIRFFSFTNKWEQSKVGDYYEFKNGLNKGKEFFGIGTPIVNFKDVFNNRGIISETLKGKVKLEPSEIKNYGVKKGDLFFTRTSETIEEIGYPSVMLEDAKDTTFSGFVLRGRCFLEDDPLEDLFKKYVFITEAFRVEMLKKSSMTTRALTSGTAIKNMEFFHPSSKKEQKKIGLYFTNIDNLITLHQRKLALLKVTKKSMLQKMFPKAGESVPEIRFEGFTDAWEQCKLGNIIEYIVDNRGKNPSYYCRDGIPVIDNYMIKNTLYPDLTTANRFIDEDLFDNFIRKYNESDDILITLVGNGIGNISLFPNLKAVIIQNTLGLRTSENKRFLFFLLMSKNRDIVALDRGMAQPSIRQDEILDIDILTPKKKEQEKIGEYFSNLDNLITLNERELDLLKNFKKSMLQQMFI